MKRFLNIVLIFFFLAGCSSSVTKSGKGTGSSNNSSSSNNSNNSENANPTLCGDGALDPGELCDPAISEGSVGACPTTCAAPDTCSSAALIGSAMECSLECVVTDVACRNDDGCCPTGCDGSTDNDCSNTCGDGTTEGAETCDGDCPTACDDGNSCTTDALTGSAQMCSAQCTFTAVTACIDNDDCCPAGCDGLDNDCACVPDDPCQTQECGMATNSCGTQVSCGGCGDGESCNAGTCETTPPAHVIGTACNRDNDCDANGVCLDDRTTILVGGYCSKSCSSNADCPTGTVCNDAGHCLLSCSSDNDCPRNDYICSSFDDVSTDVCFVGGTGSGAVGDSCAVVGDCSGGTDGICFAGDPGGYCSLVCSSDFDCPNGSHCATGGICLDSCTSNASCRSDYGCGDTDFDGNDECVALANGVGSIGDGCSSSQDCSGGVYGICAENANFPNGYCTVWCGTGAGSCPSGSFCSQQFGQPLCLESCGSDVDCRSGYTCEDIGDGQTGCFKL